MNIAIIGAGNGGQAMAGHFSLLGHQVSLFNRSKKRIADLIFKKRIVLKEAINGEAEIHTVTNDISVALKDAELIMITTTADAHRDVARLIAPYLQNDQIIVLNPGRTLGALEFSKELYQNTDNTAYIAEAQSLIYACRAETSCHVRIIGIKNKVFLSAYPSVHTDYILNKLNSIYSCFSKATSILVTGLENIGAIFHPAIVLFNAAAIERGELFYFYQDMTPSVANFLCEIDNERLKIGKAFGITLVSASEWISHAYNNIHGRTLCEKMRSNPAYHEILAPVTLHSRLMLEDVPTGILPFVELARMGDVDVPLMKSVLTFSESLLGMNFRKSGRTLKNLGLENLTVQEFVERLKS